MSGAAATATVMSSLKEQQCRLLGLTYSDEASLREKVRSGLPAEAFRRLAEALSLAPEKLADVLGVESARTSSQKLSKADSEVVARVARVLCHAIGALGDLENAVLWITSPNPALDGRIPLELLDAEPGAERVDTTLTRLEHGVY